MSSAAGIWPVVDTQGDLDRARTEWLHTNGAGAYAMSTLALMHTRRQHGILVASHGGSAERYVVVSHAEALLEVGDRHFRLSTHQFPGIAPTPGYRSLRRFSQDPLPRWTYKVDKHEFERTLALAPGHNILVLGYTWRGPTEAKLMVRPLLPLRKASAITREHGAMMQRVVVRLGEVEVQPVPDLPPIVFSHSGIFMGSPDWWRRFEYEEDQRAGLPFEEDMWTPGVFELPLTPGVTSYLVAAFGDVPKFTPERIIADARAAALDSDVGPLYTPEVRRLSISASAFCLDRREPPLVVAGYPHLGAYVRDMVLAIPGLYLACGRVQAAIDVVRTVLSTQKEGLLSEQLLGSSSYASAPDATLWLFDLARVFVEQVGLSDPFVLEELYPALARAFERISGKERRTIWLTEDGLVANSEPARALTWMDSHLGDRWVSQRQGLVVEWQALWARGCETLALLANQVGHYEFAERATTAKERTRARFGARFWCGETDYPFDCVSEVGDAAEAWADRSIRPNAVIALAVDPRLFLSWQRDLILARANQELLTPRGLRTLAPSDPRFVGRFGLSEVETEAAYHQGGVWPHLLGFFVRATIQLKGEDRGVRDELRTLLVNAAKEQAVEGQVAQFAEGEEPLRLRGCPAYAVAVAEILRCLVIELSQPEGPASTRSFSPTVAARKG
ncbi:MAG: amylo-alpha-1,6-glucosidase [Polyangiaceae bacterium]|nr:amylo-alpha-1,6-glucosidase [Polyangiaceae bacterium]